MDKDGNELDGECSRPQKHAKSPELAREFLCLFPFKMLTNEHKQARTRICSNYLKIEHE
ncbi:hypothetical protein HanRHA438_Chr13g0587071 [Helianthus annuus]|uniref:Uncharacterized protein n=1 Tax=Helianthus annuus TaxID=4232 RepID=A0A9K3EGB6_HELAN|nr:hypothetical protein HanXRQr2_Chr13g0576281 [Helianthus annuus]KAJ0476010.1 hypothetical protein HanHA300_Chr13g0472251 [Helianthus annuus]KAJ0496814.1 hypothetical protein HanHA89_Chr13g0504141 [Helianthus annuus]KAJ0848219.1 hypothetical protein HanPSC8_Chr13g0554581 [Helianthus annuus]KAJ0857182.1 hypothetical protein HanRHA438_Chr13g0587071 [Helianthus annuus]